MIIPRLASLRSRRLVRRTIAVVLALGATASVAHAHGGMAGPDELGPPLLTSVALAFVCYWLVILWPSPKRKYSDDAPPGKKMTADGRRASRVNARNGTASSQSARLRKVQSGRSVTSVGRKAGDA
jgi:hypothetical protein